MAGPSKLGTFQRRGGSTRLYRLIKVENSHIAEVNLPLVDLSDGNLTTLKSPPKHHGISHKEKNLQLLP